MTTSVTAPAGARHSRPARGGQAAAGEPLIEADPAVPDIVEVWGNDSFPASDAPANW